MTGARQLVHLIDLREVALCRPLAAAARSDRDGQIGQGLDNLINRIAFFIAFLSSKDCPPQAPALLEDECSEPQSICRSSSRGDEFQPG